MSSVVQRPVPLAEQVLQVLRERIDAGIYESGSQIPPETELAAEFDVSRATVRSALKTLETQGRLVRRQGAGTFVSHLPHITNPLDRAIDFQELIASFGFKPSVRFVYTGLGRATRSVARGLDLEEGDAVLESHKVFCADGTPVIYCVNSLPVFYLEEGLLETVLSSPEVVEPIYEFFERRVGNRVELHVSSIHVATAGSTAFHRGLPLDPSQPVLVLESVAYSSDARPLFHTFEYHHHPDDMMTLELVRHRW